MAITIIGAPAGISAIGSVTTFMMESTNVGNDGFQFVVETTLSNGVLGTYMVTPNQNNVAVFSPYSVVKPYMKHTPNSPLSPTTSIHSLSGSDIGDVEQLIGDNTSAGFIGITCLVTEAWIIDGVFTIQTAGSVSVDAYYHNAQLSIQVGNNLDYYNYLEVERSVITDRENTTSYFDFAETIALNNNCIFIPTFESDWGVFSLRQGIAPDIGAEKIKLSILPSSGPPVQEVYDIPLGFPFYNAGLFPANLNTSSVVDIPKPSDYPNWKAVYFQLLNASDEIVSKTIVMYNAERYGECLNVFTKVRLAWVGRYGGWEYWNFTKKSEESYTSQKDIAQRVIGNYGTASGSIPFTFNSFDEGEVVVNMEIQKYLMATSDNLSDGEFEYLKGLFLSKQVHWVHDDGTHTPVIVQQDEYSVRKKYGGGRMYNLQVKVKIAQPQFN